MCSVNCDWEIARYLKYLAEFGNIIFTSSADKQTRADIEHGKEIHIAQRKKSHINMLSLMAQSGDHQCTMGTQKLLQVVAHLMIC